MPSDAAGCVLGAKQWLTPCPCEVGRGQPLSNDAAKINLLTPQKHPAALGAVFLHSSAIACSYCGAMLVLLTKGCINVTEGSFSLASAIV